MIVKDREKQRLKSCLLYTSPGYAETIPDITLVSDALTHSVMNWEVLEDYTGSDHQSLSPCGEFSIRP